MITYVTMCKDCALKVSCPLRAVSLDSAHKESSFRCPKLSAHSSVVRSVIVDQGSQSMSQSMNQRESICRGCNQFDSRIAAGGNLGCKLRPTTRRCYLWKESAVCFATPPKWLPVCVK